MASRANRILAKVKVGAVVKSGQSIVLSVATETQDWKKPSETAQKQGDDLKAAVEGNMGMIKPGTKEIVQRDSAHFSEKDTREHITALQLKQVAADDSKIDGTSTHFVVQTKAK